MKKCHIKVGDIVTSDWEDAFKRGLFVITAIEHRPAGFGSEYGATATRPKCEHCGDEGITIGPLDSTWFYKPENKSNEKKAKRSKKTTAV